MQRSTGSETGAANAYLVAAIASEVTATVSLKAALTEPSFIAVIVVGYLASFFLLAMTLRNGKSVAAAYGIWGASGVVLTAVASYFIFDEAISPRMAIGFCLIALGVVVVEASAGMGAQGRAARERASASVQMGAE